MQIFSAAYQYYTKQQQHAFFCILKKKKERFSLCLLDYEAIIGIIPNL